MFKDNLKVFLVYLVVIFLFILLKNGQIFDVSALFRYAFSSPQMANSLLLKPDDLEQVNQKLLSEIENLKELESENKKLKELLDYKNSNEYQFVVVDILNRDPINSNILILSAGKKDGIKEGQAAVVNDGVIVGKIVEVDNDSSKLRLLTDNFSKIAVKVSDDYEVSGVLSGSLGLGMDLTYIPEEQDIKKGDLVITSNMNDLIPAGLIVGTVEEVQFSKEEIFKSASILPMVDYQTLSLLAIIKK